MDMLKMVERKVKMKRDKRKKNKIIMGDMGRKLKKRK
jgi:hypothetical protein